MLSKIFPPSFTTKTELGKELFARAIHDAGHEQAA
ncbi:hypothetical protein HRM2_04150 [Desulforapulum autotrophicum HRM2]|uniref:Uncharacterized protein n=1 Tax=Desulforapulum autotrophicum (strain ATCC 43914 / DSM 3382 / VKM B-1955 / HRM2) TaxID=177437 RepID=C0QGQ8_DESAH|nr:hypothetical protein HRM2_04150 [Desulforapulum autotrophicum HRM2]